MPSDLTIFAFQLFIHFFIIFDLLDLHPLHSLCSIIARPAICIRDFNQYIGLLPRCSIHQSTILFHPVTQPIPIHACIYIHCCVFINIFFNQHL
ncbi:hypothetical protein Hanom_Chr09g00841031 [Helianthus anomalus]